MTGVQTCALPIYFSVNSVPLLSEVPTNVSFSPFSSICQSSEAPLPLFQRLLALSHKGGFNKDVPSDRLMNSLGSFTGRDFLASLGSKHGGLPCGWGILVLIYKWRPNGCS